MTSADRPPIGPAFPNDVTVVFGGAADVALLHPLWLALHRIHQQADPELAPHDDDETSWRRLAIGAVPGNTGALRFYERRGYRPTWTMVTRFAARAADAPET